MLRVPFTGYIRALYDLSRSDDAGSVVPSVVSLLSVRQTAERLFRFQSPRASWEKRVQEQSQALLVLRQAVAMEWLSPMLVLWFSDAAGSQACQQVYEAGVLYSLHGLWYSSHHEPTLPSKRSDPGEILPRYLQLC